MNKNHLFLFMGLCSLLAFFPTHIHAATENKTQIYPSPMGQALAREKPKLLLYYLPWCPYCQRVLDCLERIHRTIPMKNLQQDPKGKDELKKIGGKMQVPCLMIDGKPMYESAAIIHWLSQNKLAIESD